MIRTFGLGPRSKNRRFWAFGLGPRSKIVGKSQGKRKNKAMGKMINFGHFWSVDGQIVPKKRPRFNNFPNVSRVFCVFSHLTTPHNTHTIPHAFLSVSSGFQCFSTRTTPHNIHNTQTHTHTHTCTPATDRDLESGLSTTRGKTLENA